MGVAQGGSARVVEEYAEWQLGVNWRPTARVCKAHSTSSDGTAQPPHVRPLHVLAVTIYGGVLQGSHCDVGSMHSVRLLRRVRWEGECGIIRQSMLHANHSELGILKGFAVNTWRSVVGMRASCYGYWHITQTNTTHAHAHAPAPTTPTPAFLQL